MKVVIGSTKGTILAVPWAPQALNPKAHKGFHFSEGTRRLPRLLNGYRKGSIRVTERFKNPP